jgi:hypothetical protein
MGLEKLIRAGADKFGADAVRDVLMQFLLKHEHELAPDNPAHELIADYRKRRKLQGEE